ncbi:MAG: hypothetical protein LH473_04565, partial [Chitinophagales bacterium]|nr:hypothetical protein [Chitinophagales bacterium]
MLDIETQLTIDGHNVTLKTGKIEVHNDDWLSIKNASVDIDDIKIDGVDALPSNNKGLYIESPVTLCSIHNSTFTDLALGIELNYVGQNPGADIFTNTFTNCKVPVKSHSSNNIGITLCTMSESITTGSIGILIQGGYGITVSNTLVQQFETGAQLSLCKGFYLTSASKIYDTHTGISGANSEIFIRNGAKVELTLTAGVNLTGTYTTSPYPHYTSMLTMGDQGCGNIVDCYGDCITGSNFILNIDPIIHDGNDGDNNPSYNPNWISRATGQAGKYFNICYNQIGNPSHAPTLIYARKNFWVPYSTTNVAPTSSNVFIGSTTGSSCFNSNVARTYTPMTQCATPSTYDCMYCVGTLKGEEEEDDNGNEVSAASIVMASYESANEEFLVEDAPDTRAQFDDVSALELNYDSLTNQWSVTTLAGVTLPTDDSTVLRIMAAKVLYDDGDSTEEKLTAGLQ